MSRYKKQLISELSAKLKKRGYRVFIAESGTYGFYTDDTGSRLISFQVDLLSIKFSGNYTSNNPKQTGTGWRISDSDNGDYDGMFDAYPPQWAISDTCRWHYTTLDQHLAIYQQSSKYTEIN